ncbi:MAG: ABC transporter ATP-binding protein [Clostridia bacterium]|nr:ABC transporter ATP-binding protein [Clostridia bacterium]
MSNKSEKLLEVRHLKTQFSTDEGIAHAVEDVSFDLKRGETLGIVGESGSGKSVTMLSVIRLVTGKITDGEILFDGRDLRKLSDKEMIALRGKDITMVFQDPMTSLDPVYTIGFQLMEPILKHNKCSRQEAFDRAVQMLEKVGIANARERMKEYPHQLSGGMRQRVIIAMALTCNPKLLIADEPTTALDVTIQAQILDLMKQLKKDSDMSIILITHDLGVVAQMCDRVNVMYCGQIVESAPVNELFHDPRHKYTQGLLHSIPRLDQEADKLDVIQGSVPSIVMLPTGCRFHPRCPYATEKCRTAAPEMVQVGEEHFAACHYALKEADPQ